jgi:lipid-binding SYLF domain-containing protein
MTQLRLKIISLGLVLLFAVAGSAMANKFEKTIDTFSQSDAVKPFFDDAYGYAVFPRVGKGGIVLGGAYGAGRIYKQGDITGTVTLTKVSVGFQLGGQAFSQIIFFENEQAYNNFTSGNFEFDGSFSAVVITAAAQAKAGTEGGTAGASLGPATGAQAESSYKKGMAVFVHTLGGLMYEMSIGGQKFDFTPL